MRKCINKKVSLSASTISDVHFHEHFVNYLIFRINNHLISLL